MRQILNRRLKPEQAQQHQDLNDDHGDVRVVTSCASDSSLMSYGSIPTGSSLRSLDRCGTDLDFYCFVPSHASRNVRSAAVSWRPVCSTGTTCRRGSSSIAIVTSLCGAATAN